MEKLKVLRQFYLLVLAYMYPRRIRDGYHIALAVGVAGCLLCGVLYTHILVHHMVCYTPPPTLPSHTHASPYQSYKFRPVPDNPYFKELSDDTDKVSSSLLVN